jgi:hypothetical protein
MIVAVELDVDLFTSHDFAVFRDRTEFAKACASGDLGPESFRGITTTNTPIPLHLIRGLTIW